MTYTISNQKLSIEISNHGAEIKRILFNGLDYLHDSNPQFWNRSAPLLFPNIGSIKDGFTIINNKQYPLTKHGFIRDRDFLVTAQEKSSITFTYISNENDLILYPFEFSMDVTYQIHGDILKSYIVIKNLSSDTMLFNLGLHPAFKIPLEPNEKFEDYYIDFKEPFSDKSPLVNLQNGTIDFEHFNQEFTNLQKLPLNYDDYINDALIFSNLKSHVITLTNQSQSHGIRFEFHDFPMLGIWTPNHVKAPFICLEPWIGCADRVDHNHEFNQKSHLITLEANDSKLITYQIKFF